MKPIDWKPDYIEFNIAGCYLSGLINGDVSGLNDEDIKLLDEFEGNLQHPGYWYVISEESNFSRDEVSYLMADCYECRYYIQSRPGITR